MFKVPSDLIIRPQYQNKTEPFIGKSIIKIFTGQRRVGKSYLLFQIIDHVQKKWHDSHIIYINKEDLNFSEIKDANDLNDYIQLHKIKGKKNFIFIDEIQDVENFEQALRSLILDEDLDLYCTGSNAKLLSSDIAGHLSGRYLEFSVYSLSYAEFLNFHKVKNSEDSLEKYMKYGGFPYIRHLLMTDHVIFEYLQNIYLSIVYRDIVNRYSVRNTVFLEQLILFLADNTGSLFSAKKISDYLKSQKINISHNQVQLYTQYLANAFIVHKVPRFDISGKRIFETGEKFYFENLGLRNSIRGYKIEDLGKIAENVVYNHLVYLGHEVNVGSLKHEEIDFVCLKNGETSYYQVALTIKESSTLDKEFGNLQKIDDHYPKTVITLDEFKGNSVNGVKHKSLRSFLMSVV